MNLRDQFDDAKLRESIFGIGLVSPYNAFLEPNWELYVTGFKSAADQLVELHSEHMINYTAYPVMFLYRHYLEIRLKHVFITLTKFQGGSTNFPKGHDLKVLWGKVRPLMEKEWQTPDYLTYYDDIGDRLAELQDADVDSDGFRYPVSTSNTPSLKNIPNPYAPHKAVINLKQAKDVVAAMSQILDGTVYMIEDLEQLKKDAWELVARQHNGEASD